jgi:KDO2-lipid IV(A) lauroyltransferase
MTAKIRAVNLIEKGNSGSRKIIEALKNNELVIILADQKISEGEKIKFFHEDAITTTSIARLALKYDVDLIPARVIRFDQKSNFFVEVEKPLVIKKTLNLNEDILALTLAINQNIERWIRNSPAQWFWVHNRWKK